MPRTLQHITWQGWADDAGREGKKVETLCGERVYQMPNMSADIPTCTPCARALMAEHAKQVTTKNVTYNITWGGAA